MKKVIITFFPKKIFLITFFNYLMLFITLNKIKLKIVFFNESFDFWNKTKNIEKLPIIQWLIFSFLSKTIKTWMDCFIKITSKKTKTNFINFKLLLFFFLLIKDFNMIDCWWMNEKTQWKKIDRENNQNIQQKSNDWFKWY